MRHQSRLLAVIIVFTLAAVACAGEPPEVPLGADGNADEVLVAGREIFGAGCSNCHGMSGGGGTGPQLSEGNVVEEYPDIGDQIGVVTNGRDRMPSFGGRLTPDDIVAVVRYTREVLSLP